MTDRATPNLPSRNLARTSVFFGRLGFTESFRDPGWLILVRGQIQIEFFPWPSLNPATNIASCCIRVDDLDALYAAWRATELPSDPQAIPRLTALAKPSALREFALVDEDGNLFRCLGPPRSPEHS